MELISFGYTVGVPPLTGSEENIADTKAIIALISGSEELQNMWVKYQKKFVYAQDITHGQIIKVLETLMH